MQSMFFLILPDCIAHVAEKRESREFALHHVRTDCTGTLKVSSSLFAGVLRVGIAINLCYRVSCSSLVSSSSELSL